MDGLILWKQVTGYNMAMTNARLYIVIAAILLLVAIAMSLLLFRVPTKASDQTFNNEFSLLLQDYSGKEVHLYEYRRQILVAYAWASWCVYCGAEMQQLAKLKAAYGDKIQILAINRAESIHVAKPFTDGLGIEKDMVLLLDPNDAFFKSIGGYAMPETVFIDAHGDIVFHQRGPIDVPTMEVRLKELVH